MKTLSQKKTDKPQLKIHQKQEIQEKFEHTNESQFSLYDQRLASFLLWASNPLKEEIFIELGTILFLLRTLIICSIWADTQKDFLGLNGNILEIKANPQYLAVQLTNEDIHLLNSLVESGICPFIASKWNEIRKQSGGTILSHIIQEVEKNKEYETLFFEKIKSFETKFESKGKIVFKNLANSLLCLKETEIKEESSLKKRSNFLSYNMMEDLADLLQKLCAWLQHFNEEELKLKKIDWEINEIQKGF